MLEEVAGQGAVCVASDGAAAGSDDFDWRKAAINLAMREADYRLNHDVHGDGSLEAGRSWDRMRHSGDAIRAAALRIHPAKDDARALLESIRSDLADAARVRICDPFILTELRALCERAGYGNVMNSASALWRERLGAQAGGEFVSGPCRRTVENTLDRIDAYLERNP